MPNIIDHLIDLFQKLYNLKLPEIPQDISEPLWQKCLRWAKKEAKRKRREAAYASGLGSGYSIGSPSKPNKAEEIKFIERLAQQKYSEDPTYKKKYDQICEQVSALAEQIYIVLYSIQANLQKEPAARNTLLLVQDAQTIKSQWNDKLLISRTITALNAIAIKAAIDKQAQEQTEVSGKAGDKSEETWYWKLYEKTIKAVFSAIFG